jgi:hypothetical protein
MSIKQDASLRDFERAFCILRALTQAQFIVHRKKQPDSRMLRIIITFLFIELVSSFSCFWLWMAS